MTSVIYWELLHPDMTAAHLGYLPDFIRASDPRSAREQFDANYPHGGWRPLNGFKLTGNNSLRYPGDPTLHPLARAMLRDELIVLYPADFVAIIQPDRSFSVARLD